MTQDQQMIELLQKLNAKLNSKFAELSAEIASLEERVSALEEGEGHEHVQGNRSVDEDWG